MCAVYVLCVLTILNPRHIYIIGKKGYYHCLLLFPWTLFFSLVPFSAIGHRRHRLSAKVATLRFKLWTPRNLNFFFNFFYGFASLARARCKSVASILRLFYFREQLIFYPFQSGGPALPKPNKLRRDDTDTNNHNHDNKNKF